MLSMTKKASDINQVGRAGLEPATYGLKVLGVLQYLRALGLFSNPFLTQLAAGLLCVGCNVSRGHEYRLVIDGRFTPDQVEAIAEAADMWEAKVTVKFNLIMDTCPASDWHDTRSGVICISPTSGGNFPGTNATPATVAQTWNNDSVDGANVFVSLDRMAPIPDYWKAIVAHELGHAMGLLHNNEAVKDSATGCTLMHSTTSPNQEVTSEDVAAWEALR